MVVVAAIALISVSCSSGSSNSLAAASTTTAAPTTTTAAPSTTTAAPTTTTAAPTTTAALTCGGNGGIPVAAANHSIAAADVDGDGAPDTIHTYTLGDPMAAGAWWVQVSFASGGGDAAQVLDPGVNLSGSRPIDGYDINGDGRDEFFATVGAGASAQIIAVFDVPGCTIRRAGLGGVDAAFPISGGINFTSGIACTDVDGNGLNDFLVIRDGQRIGSTSDFTINVTSYSLLNGQLSQVSSNTETVNTSDPAFADYGRLVCGPVTWS